MRYRPKHIVEYGALRVLAAFVNALPYRVAMLLGWALAGLSFLILRARVKTALQRIGATLHPPPPPRQAYRLAWRSWRNLAFNIVEVIRIGRISRAWLRTHSNADTALEPLLAHARTGRGAVIAIPHMGNWDVGAMTCHLWGVPIFSISGRQSNPLVDAYLQEQRRKPGIQTVAKGSGAMRAVISRLRAGQVLAIMPDVRVRTEAITVNFLGGKANIGGGMALFARQTGVPIFPCHITRGGWSGQSYFVGDPIWPDPALPKAEDAVRLTQAVFDYLERCVRAEPEQWFWFNKRWILDPVTEKDD